LGYADLHSHVLPALDDGAPDDATGLLMIRLLASAGYDLIFATPHQKAAQFLPAWDDVTKTHSRIAAASEVELRLGAENFWDDVFYERWRSGTVPRYTQSRAFLFEIPVADVPARFEDTLFQIGIQGLLPVMAHPERYLLTPERLDAIGRSVPLVVDLGAIAGYHGQRPGRLAQKLLVDGIAHAAASDVHTPADVRAAMEGIAWIKKRLGAPAVARLCADNPRAILAGEVPDRS